MENSAPKCSEGRHRSPSDWRETLRILPGAYKVREPAHERHTKWSLTRSMRRLLRLSDETRAKQTRRKKTKVDVQARALYRMQLLTYSQIATIWEHCGLNKTSLQIHEEEQSVVEKLMVLRDERGDFDEEENEEVQEPIPLPIYMDGVNESFMHFGLLRTDLQLECLLRNIPYKRSDPKSLLILKLMEFKEKLSSTSKMEVDDT